MSSRMCFVETEDWYECKSRKKHRAFQNFVKTEMAKMDIYSLPTYDHGTDTFKDGPLPKGVDSYFAKAHTNYYNDAIVKAHWQLKYSIDKTVCIFNNGYSWSEIIVCSKYISWLKFSVIRL